MRLLYKVGASSKNYIKPYGFKLVTKHNSNYSHKCQGNKGSYKKFAIAGTLLGATGYVGFSYYKQLVSPKIPVGVSVPVEFADKNNNKFIAKRFESAIPGEVNIVAIDQGKIIGSLCYMPDPDSSKHLYFYKVAVSPEARGRGIGKALVSIVVEDSYQQGKGITGLPLASAANFYQNLIDKVVPVTNRFSSIQISVKNNVQEKGQYAKLSGVVIAALRHVGIFTGKMSTGKPISDKATLDKLNQLDDAYLEEQAEHVYELSDL